MAAFGIFLANSCLYSWDEREAASIPISHHAGYQETKGAEIAGRTRPVQLNGAQMGSSPRSPLRSAGQGCLTRANAWGLAATTNT